MDAATLSRLLEATMPATAIPEGTYVDEPQMPANADDLVAWMGGDVIRQPPKKEMMDLEELNRRGTLLPENLVLGEMPLSPGDMQGMIRALVKLDKKHPGAVKFMQKLFEGSGMKELIGKVAPTAELKGRALMVNSDEAEALAELLKGMGAPEGLRRAQDFSPSAFPKSVTTTDADTRLARSVGRESVPATKFFGMKDLPGEPRRLDTQLETVSSFQNSRPRFYDPDELAEHQAYDAAGIGMDEPGAGQHVPDFFIDWLRARTPPTPLRPRLFDVGDLDKIPKVAQEDDFVYHATNAYNLQDIKDSRKIDVFAPSYGTDQAAWPDGSEALRAYFTKSPDIARSFPPEGATPALIRVRRSAGKFKEEGYGGDIYSESPISSEAVEFLGADGKFHPIAQMQ